MTTRTAVRQALRYSHGLGFSEIARLTGSDPSSIRRGLNMGSWTKRSEAERLEAIAAAKALLEEAR